MDSIVGEDATNDEVFSGSVLPLVHKFLQVSGRGCARLQLRGLPHDCMQALCPWGKLCVHALFAHNAPAGDIVCVHAVWGARHRQDLHARGG